MKITEVNVAEGETIERDATVEERRQQEADRAAAAASEKIAADASAKRAADERAWRDAVKNASSLAALKDVLLGTNLPVQADSRPTGP